MARHPKITRQIPEDSQLTGYLEKFLTSRRARGVQSSTVHGYDVNLTIYLNWLTRHPKQSWDEADTIDLFLAEQRDEGLMDNTILSRYRAMSIWFGWLCKRKIISDNPMDMIDAPVVRRPAIQHMTLAEYQQLIGSITGNEWIDKRDRCLLYVIFWCGLRISEACNLRQSDIDLATKTVTVRRGKGGDARFVPCGDDLYPIVLDYLWSRPSMVAEKPGSSGQPILAGQPALEWLFVGCNGGGGVRGKLTPGGAAIMMKRRCQAAGMRVISPHKGRHGLAMELLNAGLEMSAVSKVLGHSNQKTTADFYAKWLTGPLVRQYTEVRDQLLGNSARQGKPEK